MNIAQAEKMLAIKPATHQVASGVVSKDYTTNPPRHTDRAGVMPGECGRCFGLIDYQDAVRQRKRTCSCLVPLVYDWDGD